MDATLAGRYLADQLTPEERERYERWLCTNPDAVRELEAAARLKVGLQVLQERGELRELLPLARASAPRARAWMPALALAASLAVLTIGVLLWRGASPRALPIASSLASLQANVGHAFSATASLTVMRMRSGGDDATLSAPAKAAAVELRVLPDAGADAARYTVRLQSLSVDDKLKPVALGGPVAPGADGYLDLFLPAAALAPGRYVLELTPVGAGSAELQRFSLRVNPASPRDSVQ